MTKTTTKLQLSERQTADFEMIGNGGFAPLTGPQGSEDWKSVVENMTLSSGEYWPIPITLATDLDASEGDTIEAASR
jgi:sulfate adenylyltransferase